MKYKQQSFFINNQWAKEFGGSLLKNKRKVQRPLSTRVPMHLILRSNHKEAHKAFSYRIQKNRKILDKLARKFHIKIYESVFNYTHLHLVIRISHRDQYNAFIRQLSAQLSKLANLKRGELFGLRPYTRILSWGREFKIVMNYMKKNYVEAIGTLTITWSDLPTGEELRIVAKQLAVSKSTSTQASRNQSKATSNNYINIVQL